MTATVNTNDWGTTINDPDIDFGSVSIYTIDGTGNNPTDPALGAAGSDETRIAPGNFVPGTTNTPVSGTDPRVISNVIFANDANANDPAGRSAYMYAFGQFIDHDIDLNKDQTVAPTGRTHLA
jgi:hypothetical protein